MMRVPRHHTLRILLSVLFANPAKLIPLRGDTQRGCLTYGHEPRRRNLISDATNRKPVMPSGAVVPVDSAIVVAQCAVPGEWRAAHYRTPPVAKACYTAERPKDVTAAARKCFKTTLVGCTGIRANP